MKVTSKTRAGIGLRHPHLAEIAASPPDVGWMEIHPENYFGGGINRHYLKQVSAHFPVSFHAVGLSLGSHEPVKEAHLVQIKALIDLFQPFQISDHAAWSASGNAHLNDLLPLPYTQETLDALCRNIERTQEFFGQRILVENPSTYVSFPESTMAEYVFLNRVCATSGCGLLLDLNNIYVQAHNHGLDARDYLNGIEADVGEMHLAGHSAQDTLLIDTHNQPVCEDVWDLYAHAVRRFGAVPTLIEWDKDVPALDVLVAQAHKADEIMAGVS